MERSKCALWRSQGGMCGASMTFTLRWSCRIACLVYKLKLSKVRASGCTSCHESEIKGKVVWCGNVSRCAMYFKQSSLCLCLRWSSSSSQEWRKQIEGVLFIALVHRRSAAYCILLSFSREEADEKNKLPCHTLALSR